MDSLSQIVLGGAVGFAVAGKTAPRKAILCGAVIATLPDLDVFINFNDDVTAFTEHRSWSHSWLIQSILSPLIAYLLYRFDSTFNFKQWCLLVWLALVTHSLLDAQTVYGTQLFWPFMPPPYSGGSIFIIDPIYTLPLVIGFIAVLIKPLSTRSHWLIKTSLVVSTAYLIWALLAQTIVLHKAKQDLANIGINNTKILATPTPLNTLLWRVLVIDNDVYYEGFRSFFDGDNSIEFKYYNRHLELIHNLEPIEAFKRLDWFTDGFYSLNKQDNHYVVTDLRMGLAPRYFFQFSIATVENDAIVATTPKRLASERQAKQTLSWVWQRIWSDDVRN